MNAVNKPLFPQVTVNGHTIDQADIAAEAQNHSIPAGKPGLAWRAAARALIIRHLLLEQAKAMDLTPEPAKVAPGKTETEDEARIRQVLEQKLAPALITEDDINHVYEADKTRFFTPDLYEAAHILFAIDPAKPDAEKMAQTRGENCLKILADHPNHFARLAQENSDCSSAANGGVLGQLSTGDTVPEFDAALATMAPGELSTSLTRSRYGFHIIRLDAHANGARLPLSAVSREISDALEKHAWANAARVFAESLLTKADVTGVKIAAV